MFRYSENKGFVAQQICGALLPLAESAALAGNQKVLRELLEIGCKFNDREQQGQAGTLRRNSALYLKLLQVGALYGETDPTKMEEANKRLIPISPTELHDAGNRVRIALQNIVPDLQSGEKMSDTDQPRYPYCEYQELYALIADLRNVFNHFEGWDRLDGISRLINDISLYIYYRMNELRK